MRKRAFIDIAILGLVFWSVWSLRFAGVENIGLWSILAAVAAGAMLIAIRKEFWRDYGLRVGGNARFVLSRAAEFSILALVTGFTVIGLATAFGYPPSQSAVLTQQPETLSGFLLDIVFGKNPYFIKRALKRPKVPFLKVLIYKSALFNQNRPPPFENPGYAPDLYIYLSINSS